MNSLSVCSQKSGEDKFLQEIFLSTVNFDEETDLCRIMNRYGSDKGNGHHNYTLFYEYLFDDIRGNDINVFELGLGTNNPNILSNMGVGGKPGASLYGWKEYFPKSKVYGADIDRNILFNTDGITTFYCDQTDISTISDLWTNLHGVEFDIIIEDGLHTFDAHWKFLVHSLQKVKKGGYYIVEDIMPDNVKKIKDLIPSLKLEYDLSYISIFEIPNRGKNEVDNTLLVIKK